MGRHAGPIVSQFSSFAAVLNVIFSVSLFFHTKFEEYASVDRVIFFVGHVTMTIPRVLRTKRGRSCMPIIRTHCASAYYVIA